MKKVIIAILALAMVVPMVAWAADSGSTGSTNTSQPRPPVRYLTWTKLRMIFMDKSGQGAPSDTSNVNTKK